MTTPQEITFEEWNEQPNQFKASFKLNRDPLLQAIEDHPTEFTYFDDGTVRNYVGVAVIETSDYDTQPITTRENRINSFALRIKELCLEGHRTKEDLTHFLIGRIEANIDWILDEFNEQKAGSESPGQSINKL